MRFCSHRVFAEEVVSLVAQKSTLFLWVNQNLYTDTCVFASKAIDYILAVSTSRTSHVFGAESRRTAEGMHSHGVKSGTEKPCLRFAAVT